MNYQPWFSLWHYPSRIFLWREWKQRERLLRTREQWTLDDWLSALNAASYSDEVKRSLEHLADCMNVNWKTVRPDDRLWVELRIPCRALHATMVGEYLECLETELDDRTGIAPEELPEPAFEPCKASVGELVRYVVSVCEDADASRRE